MIEVIFFKTPIAKKMMLLLRKILLYFIQKLVKNIKIPYTFPKLCNSFKININYFLDTEEVASSNLVDPTPQII